MKEDFVQNELDKKKYFFVKYAFIISLLILGLVIYSLFILKINNEAVFKLFLKYYIL